MKAKTIVPLIIGLGVGFFAIKMGMDMVKRAKGSQEELRGVLVSSKTIEIAAKINKSMLSPREVPASLIPDDAFVDREKLVGRVTKVTIPAGVPITRGMLAPPGAEPGLGAKIPRGMRAVSVSVNEQSAVAGFITPGSRVDVSAVYGRSSSRSKLILSDIEVGAVGQSLSQVGPDGKTARVSKSVTLFLIPEQVQILNAALGTGKGRIRLALRGYSKDPTDSLLTRLFKKTADSLPTPKLAPVIITKAKEPEKPVFHVVEVRRGVDVRRLVFDQNGGFRRMEGGTSRHSAKKRSTSSSHRRRKSVSGKE